MADWLQGVIILGMFVVRLGLPLLLTLAVGYWLRRLDAKWQAEAWARLIAEQEADQSRHAVDTNPAQTPNPPCWIFKDCPEAVRHQCPATQRPDLPCWLARQRSDGRIPSACYRCARFAPRPVQPLR